MFFVGVVVCVFSVLSFECRDLMLTNLYLIAWCCESVVSSDLEEGLRHFRRSIESPNKGVSSYLSTHTVYLHKIFKKIIIGGGGGGGGVWPYWKMDTGKHKFHEILLLYRTEQKD